MTDKALPILQNNTSYADTDEIFAHGILQAHNTISNVFHADWGANIIAVNDKSFFTEFPPCDECLNPIDGIPVSGIKGFDTIIFQIGSRLFPVREIAYMPANPQCIFTTSHLQRLNGFLNGIHAMHSSVKLISPDGITAKYIPEIKQMVLITFLSLWSLPPHLQQKLHLQLVIHAFCLLS